jgi:hypothetical protein
MIGITNFGWRLGNQMFQIAAAESVAKANNDKVAYPKWSYAQYFNGDFEHVPFEPKHVIESPFHYEKIEYKDGLSISGYFQSEKYFQNCKNHIRKIFSFKDEIVKSCENLVPKKYSCGIHIRRGDYLNFPHYHPQQQLDYFEKAIKVIKEKNNDTEFYVFSDDIDWCKQQSLFNGFNFIDKELEDYKSLYLMTRMNNFIITNSSFSWWGAFLIPDKDKTIIAPSVWFGPGYAHFNTNDIYCDGWVKI